MTKTEQKLFDELDWAFDQMEQAMAALKRAGLDHIARGYGARWVEVNDDFHAERAAGGSGNAALKEINLLEDKIVKAMNQLRVRQR